MQNYWQRLIAGCRSGLVVVGLLLLIVGCAPAAPGASSGSAAAAADPCAGASLRFWTTGLAPETDKLVQDQVNQFCKDKGIKVEYTPIPFAEFEKKLQTATAAGTPPDIIGSWSYTMMQLGDGLEPLNELSATNNLALDDFIEPARQNNSLQEILYAMPWHRDRACSPYYTSVGILASSKQKEDAFHLIQFLTDTEQQVNNTLNTYNKDSGKPAEASLLPTRLSAYNDGRLKFDCPIPGAIIYTTAEDQQTAMAIVQSRMEKLQPVLDKNSEELTNLLGGQQQTLNVERVAPVVTYDEYTEPTFIKTDGELKSKIIAIAVPITINFSKDAFQAALEKGVIVGAIFGVDEPITLILKEGKKFTIESNVEFALKLRATGNDNEAELTLVNSDTEEAVGLVNLIGLRTDVDQPDVTVETGSCYFKYKTDSFWIPLQFETKAVANAVRWWYITMGYQVTPVVCQ